MLTYTQASKFMHRTSSLACLGFICSYIQLGAGLLVTFLITIAIIPIKLEPKDKMVSPGKATFVLLVVVVAVVCCLGCSVSGTPAPAPAPVCTEKEKVDFIHVCSVIIDKKAPANWIQEDCCRMALEMQQTNKQWLNCIAGRLTKKEKKKYNLSKIRNLETICPALPPTPSLDLVKTNFTEFCDKVYIKSCLP